MNASTILDDTMTLEEKLKAIEQAMNKAQEVAKEKAEQAGEQYVPIDPATLTMCEGCQ